MSRAFLARADSDTISSDLELLSEEMRPLVELELGVAEKEGLSKEEVDPLVVLSTAKSKLLHDGGYLLVVVKLEQLRHLRLQYSRAQRNLPVSWEIRLSPSGDPHRVDASRFSAVLIGIDEYASYPLQGSVSDVKLMEKYLIEDLGVPSNRIQLLVGSKEHTSLDDPIYPSRAHIVGALRSLITNPAIAHGDNIVIYYSGHGSYYSPHTEEDSEAGYIEALCPIDRDAPGDNGKPVPDISDREFNMILSLIAEAKGHHITVILDCCHSGGVCRSIPELGARTSPPTACASLSNMLDAGEKNLMHYPGYRSILAKDWFPDMDSHVALAACKDYQYARAKRVKRADGTVEGYIGIFTDSLVRVLRSGLYQKETTYAHLVRYLDKTSHQTPVVAGKHKHARLWYQG
ncbi:caspase domain-containing protein [Armillaria luteobubalina]|uniref:Caspase domain-containing protein n=1 Tax=Armillaria luteobubalina TaxID=153913 RepID=A0AA39P159_9AGAR|nr:caspase domain-containing protein [Armillaria luteobubalina]